MHCWKTINIKHEYGTTRLTLWSVIVFILVFCFSFVLFGYLDPIQYTDHLMWLFLLILFCLYPIHKLVHFLALLKFRKNVQLKIKFDYLFIPIIRLRLKDLVPKKRYIFVLLFPFIIINSILVYVAYSTPQFTHFACLLLAYHCSMCIIDILYVKNLILAPRSALIEETPKGYEILVPANIN
nr:DUF3267 domain-containing protein [Lysinibacillus timonensis]